MKRRSIVFGVLLGAGGLFIGSAAGAAPDPWPANGFRPSCTSVQLSNSPTGIQYNDALTPTITSVFVTPKVVIGPSGGGNLVFSATANEPCSGVGTIAVLFSQGGSPGGGELLKPANNDAFHAKLSFTYAVPSSQPPAAFTMTNWLAWSRYSSFILGYDDKLLASTPIDFATAPGSQWSGVPLTCFLVDQSTFTGGTTTKTAKKGATVSFPVTLQHWDGSAVVVTPSAAISLQRKVGKGAWKKVASATTDATGKATLSFKVTATASYQVVYSPDLTKGLDVANTKPVTVTVK